MNRGHTTNLLLRMGYAVAGVCLRIGVELNGRRRIHDTPHDST